MNAVLAVFCRAVAAVACSQMLAGPALAQADTYRSRPVTIVLPASPGGASDTIARTMAQKLSEIWGSPGIIENKPGGGGAIATEYVARSRPDGYTLLSGFSEHSWMQYFSPKPNFDMNRDFAPIMLVGSVPT